MLAVQLNHEIRIGWAGQSTLRVAASEMSRSRCPGNLDLNEAGRQKAVPRALSPLSGIRKDKPSGKLVS
jgi:hypothetical protein